MNSRSLMTAAATIAALAVPVKASAQHDHGDHSHHPQLHVNPRWKECSFQLDAALTQSAWRQFTKEAGLVAYFRPLTDARPLGKGSFEVSLLQWKTGIDDHDEAWNDTFVHPDSAHWLFEGSGLAFPGLTARIGVSDRMDVGVYFTKNPNANYGFYGAQVQRSFMPSGDARWAAAARVSYQSLFGPEDLSFSVYGVDALASRTIALTSWAGVSPYAGVSTFLTTSHEKSALVSLDDERQFGAQAMVGASVEIAGARLGAEYNVARVNSLSFKVGFGR